VAQKHEIGKNDIDSFEISCLSDMCSGHNVEGERRAHFDSSARIRLSPQSFSAMLQFCSLPALFRMFRLRDCLATSNNQGGYWIISLKKQVV
jgi:hypothetical protein